MTVVTYFQLSASLISITHTIRINYPVLLCYVISLNSTYTVLAEANNLPESINFAIKDTQCLLHNNSVPPL